ncbi:type III-B CRISPR module-associated protein Cmr5 [Laribacter hongkongensis]|uniref:type III-B CRISPR module-associated protein Cmr5 n=1 Tax=Laribacter hongkongensis TaxID=168471 RepID=UPI001EFD7D7E|nr:type III-B CRISPR module-associated protein Cmr5 [Laribacter hongkongensis]MCG9059809.1 type III-B CRISPR module-associated protein Cmr5 [Laribacter hongkongensis]MCG9084150.1 type III-B CRISPR module-associated protein Cmr5 [Laribacter hongkongensis]MCG9086549.1 type III-B CRISPR module-associated protein Cmr5 [Laribacter hongkongensis]
MQTLQQQRAKSALQSVQEWGRHPDADKLVSRAAELPFMIHANGLGQAAAFFRSKQDKDGYGALYRILSRWLCAEGRPFAGHSDLLEAITHSDLHTYRVAQAEAMQYMDWVKKFARAYLGKES